MEQPTVGKIITSDILTMKQPTEEIITYDELSEIQVLSNKLRKSYPKYDNSKTEIEIELKNAELKKYLHGFESFIDIVKAYLTSQDALKGYGYKPLLDIRELPDTRIFITFPLLTENECQAKEKCDIAVACFGLNSLSLKNERIDMQIIVEDNKITHYLNRHSAHQ